MQTTNEIFTATHNKAMDYAEEALLAKRCKDAKKEQELTRLAFDYERCAADLVASRTDLEPTRSILHRSAATLACDCGEYLEALELIHAGLSGNPPVEIEQELLDLKKKVESLFPPVKPKQEFIVKKENGLISIEI